MTEPKTTTDHQTPLLLRPIEQLGSVTISLSKRALSTLGGLSLMLLQTAQHTLKTIITPKKSLMNDALFAQMVRVGVRAIPIVILIQLAIGMILPLQMFPKLDEFGQADQIATINGIAAFREMGPLMTAIILCGFAGASIAAELGTMVTSEEIEALESMALNPIRFLVIPRLLATTFMTLCLSVIADLVMILGGMITSVKLGLDADIYFQTTREAVDAIAFFTGLAKATVFGMLIGLIACHLGLAVKPWQGSDGVGKATTNTVVYSIVAVIAADAVFTVLFYSFGLF